MRHQKFTFVELLSLIAIITILAALLMPLLQSAVNTSRTVTCSNQFRQTGLTSLSYAQDNNGFLPHAYPQTDFWIIGMRPYLGDAFACSLFYWQNNKPGAANIAYCPAYEKPLPSYWPFPALPRASYGTVNTCLPNGVLNLRLVPNTNTLRAVAIRLPTIPFPSQCVLFAEARSYEPLNKWYGGIGVSSVYYNPRHNYGVNAVRVDGSVFCQPYVEKYAELNVYLQYPTSIQMADVYCWRSWGYNLIYPGAK